MKRRLLVIFPIQGPLNGVKVLTKYILDFRTSNSYDLIDTAQAKYFNDFGKFSFQKIFEVLKLAKEIVLKRDIDQVYINLSVKGFSFYRDIILILILLLKKANITAHIHANGLENIRFFLFKKIINRIKLVVINDYQYNTLNIYDRVYMLYNSLPDYYGGEKIIKKVNDKLSILYFSNLSVEKGTNRILDFVKELEPIHDHIEINICGGILDNESKETIEVLKKYDFINFINPIFNLDEKMELFRNSDVFLFLSNVNYEVFPLVYLEALMNGLPIITTNQIVSESIIKSGNGIHYKEGENLVYIKSLLQNNVLLDKQKLSRSVFLDISDFENYSNKLNQIINDK